MTTDELIDLVLHVENRIDETGVVTRYQQGILQLYGPRLARKLRRAMELLGSASSDDQWADWAIEEIEAMR